MFIEPRGARLAGIGLMVGAKCLDTIASVYALTVAPEVFVEKNSIATHLFATYGALGLALLTVAALGLLYVVVEYGARVTRRHSENGTLRKNLLSIYALGYWVPGVWWLWVGLYNVNLVYTWMNGTVPA